MPRSAALIDFIEDRGELDDTLVIVVSDNGASAEGGRNGSINDGRMVNLDPAGPDELRRRIDEIGGPSAHNNYPWGWTMAGNTPFRRWKREVHEGGVADPCIVHWPARFGESAGSIRHQFAHAVDVMPTVLELAGIEAPEQIGYVPQAPIEGTSFAYLLEADGADEPERHETQYFEMLGSRALYHRGWKAVTFKPLAPLYDDGLDWRTPFDDDVWELYHVAEDLSETDDLAAAEPDRLAEMVERWWDEARRHQVLPLDNRILHHPAPASEGAARPDHVPVRPVRCAGARARGGRRAQPLPHHHRRRDGPRRRIERGRRRRADGARHRARRLVAARARRAAALRAQPLRQGAPDDHVGRPPVPGRHELAYEFEWTAQNAGRGTLRCDGAVVGAGEIPRFTPSQFSYTGSGLTCGYEMGPAVGEGYLAPFRFDGAIHRATVEVTGRPARNPLAEFEAIMSAQ